MLRNFLIVSVIGVILTGSCSGQSGGVHYSIVAPTVFRPCSVYNVTATCYNVTKDVSLTLRLTSSNNTLTEKQALLKNGVTQIVSLDIPDDVSQESYLLVAEGQGGLKINDSRYVSVLRKTLSIFVQTDKAMYKPGQTVLIRVIVVYPDLKPYSDFFDVVVYDLAGNRIMQWLDQRNESGVIVQRLQLSDQTPLGKWKIVVNAEENSFEKTFEVAEYVLPKFAVTVSLPPYFLVNANRKDLQEDLLVTVVAKYTYGQPVKGRANVTIQLKPYSSWDNTNYTKILKDVQLVDGKADLTLTVKELVNLVPIYNYYGGYTPDLWAMLAGRTILVVASANETVTGISLSANATVLCSGEKYQLTFLDFSPTTYKPGLLYTAFMQLSQPDGKPPVPSDVTLPGGGYGQVSVLVTSYYPPKYDRYGNPSYTPQTTALFNVTITPTGYMTLSLTIDINAISANLQPSFNVSETNSTIYGYKSISVFKSRDYQGIRVTYNSPDGVITPPRLATFNVTTTEPTSTFQYEVLSKGSIMFSDNVVGEVSTEHSFSIWISRELAMTLAPNVRVVVWFITDTGEIITDSIELAISDYFANQVSLSFDRVSATPSQNVSLTVNAYAGSYVGLLAVDQSVLLLSSGNDITQDMVSSELNDYESGSNYNPGPVFAMRRRKRSIWFPIYIGGGDSLTILSNAGLLMMTDGYLYRSSYYPNDGLGPVGAPGAAGGRPQAGAPAGNAGNAGPPGATGPAASAPNDGSPGTNEDSSKPRVDFPETWIWTDAVVGQNGRVTFNATAPDTLTSWFASAFAISQVAGLGVAADKANLTVFKRFFLSPNLPYSVIRGEQFALQVIVFNYMSTKLSVLVTLQQSIYYTIQGGASKLAQVESNDAVSVYFWIVPGALGQISIDITAQSSVAGDAVRVTLLVKPEGVQQQYSTSTFIQLSSSVPTYNTTMDVTLPPTGQLVLGSQYIEMTTIGDVMGPSIKGLANLLQMPYGCGEQNMLNFAPDVYVVKYLSVSNQLTADLKNQALGFMNAGYQRELTYQRSDGSFSAFGNNDLSGSVWLSSFVIKCFHQAEDYIPVSDLQIARTMRWIIATQTANGSFAEPPNGRVIHEDMQGGSSQGLPLTAYVLISLIENENNSQIDAIYLKKSIALARKYLEDNLSSTTSDPYALSIIGYALLRAQSSKVGDVLQMLEKLAKVEGGTKHWEKTSDDSVPNLADWRPPYQQARSVNIEMTSYVLLIYSQLKNLTMSLPIAKWIIAQRNANGGFSSTQDTVMALEALAQFGILIYGPSDERNIQITIATDLLKYDFLPITLETSVLFQSYELPSNTSRVAITASGKGSALVQLNVKYNVYKTDNVSGIDLHVNSTQNGNTITIRSCSSWTNENGSGMAVIEVYTPTGFKPSNADDIQNQANGVVKRVETSDDKIVIYLDELTSNETCVYVVSDKVFPVSNLKDVPVKAYRYYDPSGGRTVFYGAPQSLGQNAPCTECPQCCTGGVRPTPSPPPKTAKSSTSPFFPRSTPRPTSRPNNKI